jgi:NAD-dependent deacetylase sirtuin 4
LRIPLTKGLPPPIIIPRNANSQLGATNALYEFLIAPPSSSLRHKPNHGDRTVLLTGAGISVASGLADYRGEKGTYTLNKTYRPVYFNEFASNHESRKRYWARSFFGFVNLNKSKPNITHHAIKALGELDVVSSVITQSKKSLHPSCLPLTTTQMSTPSTPLRTLPSQQSNSTATFAA